jgi:hypothetical protein
MDIKNALKTQTDKFIKDFRNSAQILKLAQNGQIKTSTIHTYLINLHYIFSQTQFRLQEAHDVSNSLGMPELAQFYKEKIAEEVGHENWAANDLHSLNKDLNPNEQGVLNSVEKFNNFLKHEIQKDPVPYLAYIFFVEYLTVQLGPEWISTLENNCNIPSTSMSSISNHVILDKDHAEQDLEIFDKLEKYNISVAGIFCMLYSSMLYIEDFYNELAELNES